MPSVAVESRDLAMACGLPGPPTFLSECSHAFADDDRHAY
jgi:hypothetical protein